MPTPKDDIPPFAPGQRLDARRLEQMRQNQMRGGLSIGGRGVLRRGPHGESLHIPARWPVRRARNTSGGAIAALSGSTPGSGEVTLYDWDGTSRTLGDETVEVYNDTDSAVADDAELVVLEELGDWWVLPTGGSTDLHRVRTSGTITARSGSTPGTGNGLLVDYNGTSYSDIAGTITLKNPTAGTFSSGKYGWAKLYSGSTYEIVSMEC